MRTPLIVLAPSSRSLFAGLLFFGGWAAATGLGADSPVKPVWVFELVPKAFQRDPRMDMTVHTEMTGAGKKLPPVSAQAPAYFVAHSGGYHPVGAKAGDKPVPAEEVERLLKETLARNGFLPATAEHPASFFLTYTWGPHGEPIGAGTDEAFRVVRDHAALVGGDKFAEELTRAISDRMRMLDSAARPIPLPGLGAAQGMEEIAATMDPVKLFAQKSAKNEFLVSQTAEDCYYVVVSAYDYRSVAENHRQLLWRTRMTVNARAISQSQAVPAVVVAAGPYFGRDMPEAAMLIKRAGDTGRVEIGEAKVIDLPAKSSASGPMPGK